MFDAALLLAFIDVESSFNPKAFLKDANGGSYGLLQVDYPTAQDRGFKGSAIELFDPINSIEFGVAQLQWITTNLQQKGLYSIVNLAAAYNSGLAHVLGGGTDAVYSAKITAAYAKWQAALGG